MPDLYPASTAKDVTLLAAAESARSQAIVTTRASVLAALAGLGALVTIAINYRNSRTAAHTLAITNQTFRIQQRGHLTDRYTRAIEQLGNSESIAIRLGGIYALEQIAVDTDRPGDQATVGEVLSAFFRHSIAQLGTPTRSVTDSSTPEAPQIPPLELSMDVLAALSVLSRLPRREGVDRADLGAAARNVNLTPALKPHADLTASELAHVRLADARLTGAHLDDARLDGAILTGAHLDNAQLARVDLTSADLTDAILASARLVDTRLTDANLTGATLTKADLTKADLTGAKLTKADLTGADLTRADLTRADFTGARLTGAHLSGAQLWYANLTYAYLKDAGLSLANLTGVNLTDAKLTGALLMGAHFTNADLTRADLTGADLTDADLANTRGLLRSQLTQAQTRAVASLPTNWLEESSTGE
ncbi:uncharacterized protein YjbI with pentapeptide repeats [Pseudonocardia eucalypti]|uniref:pentapeptide repeat-containing protein n=1 Tax=Pseudonocardia eucalypti TaxID=648755 RepID=UPI001612D59E|nr:uncharacterized protein YjbI with pentapeptide repeats [Pseudonocardia eucalypti]